MHETFDAKATTGDSILHDNLRRHGAVVGGVVAGLVVLGLAAYTFGTVKSATPPIATALPTSECGAQPISIVLGQDTEATLTVSPRTPCPIVTGSTAASIEEFTIVDRPKHGTLMQRRGTGIVYQSNGNFRGQDSFAFAMRGKTVDAYAGDVDGTSVVRAHVTVK
jgi:hypothetical protein